MICLEKSSQWDVQDLSSSSVLPSFMYLSYLPSKGNMQVLFFSLNPASIFVEWEPLR